jgi:hypothetical protein
MARRRAGGGVPQAVAHGAQLADRAVELVRLGREHLAVDARLALGREHARDLVEREAGGAPQRDRASRSSTPGSNRRRSPRLPVEAISPFSS